MVPEHVTSKHGIKLKEVQFAPKELMLSIWVNGISHFVPHHFITNKRIFCNYNHKKILLLGYTYAPRHLRAILHPASLPKSPCKPKGKIKAKKLHFAQREPFI